MTGTRAAVARFGQRQQTPKSKPPRHSIAGLCTNPELTVHDKKESNFSLQNEYEAFAGLYEPLLEPFLKSVRRAVVEELYIHRKETILDVCCGTGSQVRLLAENGFDRLHCLDRSRAMLGVAKKIGHAVQIHCQDATHLAFVDNSFDGVLTSLALHEKSRADQEKLISEVHRVLKPGGWFLAVDFKIDHETRPWSAWVIRLIEGFAGGDHYRHFRSFVQCGCLAGLVSSQLFEPIRNRRRAMRGIELALYQKVEQIPALPS